MVPITTFERAKMSPIDDPQMVATQTAEVAPVCRRGLLDPCRVCETKDQFVAQVIYDGRFLDSFTIEPATVAQKLGLEVAPDVLDAVHGEDPTALLADVTTKMTEEYTTRMAVTIGDGPHNLDPLLCAIPIFAAVAVGVVIATAAVGPYGWNSPHFHDGSPNADEKL